MNRKQYPPVTSKTQGLLHGGDYNPEQWPREIWDQDSRMMKNANWNSVTVGVFSWVSLEPEEGRFTFEWLDEILEIQAANGRTAGLATPSGASPAWLSQKYPETLRVGADRVRRKHGNRVNYCWTSPVYRTKTREMARRLAERYANHPAVSYVHISNEFGGECYCDLCQAAFRTWLQKRYGSLDAVNQAYWTAFWSHTYTDWNQIEAPGGPYGETAVIGLTVDWKRFTTDRIIDFYLNEVSGIREVSPDLPVTTNLMGTYDGLDCFKIAPHLDFASWDSYPWFHSNPEDDGTWLYTSFSHDLNRSLKGGQPFLLMECTPSSSNWYPVMALKRPNAHRLEGLQAIAHGADGVQYFQWRQSRGSSEQFHGAVVAHNNREDARVFREIADLGQILRALPGVQGSPKDSEVAVLYDWENAWAIEAVAAPRTERRNYMKTVLDHYRPFWESGIAVDIVNSDSDLSGYKLVVAPMLFMLREGVPERLAAFVEQGGTLVTTYWSGIVNESALAFVGGYPEPLRQALGLWSEEIDALYKDRQNAVTVHKSEIFPDGGLFKATDLCELIHAETAEVLAEYATDFYKGRPALTRNRYGKGAAFYIASRNEDAFTGQLLRSLATTLGIQPCVNGSWPKGVTVQSRLAADADYLFVLNCSDAEATITLADSDDLTDALDQSPVEGRLVLPPFGSRVLIRRLRRAAVELGSPALAAARGNS